MVLTLTSHLALGKSLLPLSLSFLIYEMGMPDSISMKSLPSELANVHLPWGRWLGIHYPLISAQKLDKLVLRLS